MSSVCLFEFQWKIQNVANQYQMNGGWGRLLKWQRWGSRFHLQLSSRLTTLSIFDQNHNFSTRWKTFTLKPNGNLNCLKRRKDKAPTKARIILIIFSFNLELDLVFCINKLTVQSIPHIYHSFYAFWLLRLREALV